MGSLTSASIAEDLSKALGSLSTLASTVADCPEVAGTMAAALEDVERRLKNEEIAIVVCGGRKKRALLNSLAGYELFAPDARELSRAIISIRRGATLRYVARHANERLEKSESVVVDGGAPLIEEVREDRPRAEVEREATSMTARPRWPRSLSALWIWSWNLLLSILRRRVDPESIELAAGDLERLGDGAPERTRAEEREAHVVDAVRALLDFDRRGHNLVTLALEVPSSTLAEGLVLVDAPAVVEPDLEVGGWHWRHVRGRVNACIFVGGEVPPSLARALAPIVPHTLVAAEGSDAAFVASAMRELPRILESVRREAPLSSLAMAAAELRERVDALPLVADAEKERVRARIAALERSRVPDPAAFRVEQKESLRGPIEFAARGVRSRALERLRARSSKLGAEWLAAIDEAKTRARLVACVASIEADGSARLRSLVDGLMDEIGSELQNTTETLLTWVLEEVARRYRSNARSKAGGDSGVLLLTDLPGDDVLELGGPPLQAALREFDRRQVAIGIGGAAVGAAVGTAVLPVLGSAVGAALGVLAGFLWRAKNLQAACSERARHHMAGVERAVATRIEKSFERFAPDIEAAVDESLGDALERRSEAIARLVALEVEALARENDKLVRLDRLRPALEGAASELRALAGRALSELLARR